jgi:ADP-heptose:LPS heptosyltransferase
LSRETPDAVENGLPWINPIGGFGDMLMLSTVLKLVVDKDPSRRFNLVRRTNYLTFLKDHPAIAAVGFPPKGAPMERVDYWSIELLGPGSQRPMQVLARHFGLQTPVEETLYIPPGEEEPPALLAHIPRKSPTVLIAPASDSPRKVMRPEIWHAVVDLLHRDGALVLQGGRTAELHIRNAYSVQGLTTPRQYIELIRACDLLITSDNFAMHAAHYAGVPAVALWGATHHGVYGYPEQTHIQMARACGLAEFEDCIAPARNEGGRLYGTPCPLAEKHCIDQVRPEAIVDAARALLSQA